MSGNLQIYTIEQASFFDALEILELQRTAFQTEAELYRRKDIPPLTQTLEEIKGQFKNHIFLKAVVKDRGVIGSVRFVVEEGVCLVGRLSVHPLFRRKGIGCALMKELEAIAPVPELELFTGTLSMDNIRFYESLGYQKKRKDSLGGIDVYYMRKSLVGES